MAEYVDRDTLIDNLQKFAPDDYSANINNIIMSQPRANVKEIIYAHQEKADGMGYYRCSHCKMIDDKYYQPEYCPHCGAEMSEVE